MQLMADRNLAVIGSILFCALVVALLLLLYYPDTTDADDDPDDQWTQEINVKLGSNLQYTEAPEPVSKMATVAKVLEDMGAGFLAVLAVICVSFGLACLTCACCVLR